VTAVVGGSFDPFTIGHDDLVRRAVRLFGQVVVGVGINSAKDYLLTLDERVNLTRASLADLPSVRVELMPGLLADFCRQHGARTIVKGARSGSDFDVEVALAQMNASYDDLETVILPSRPAWGFISSTLVRQAARGGADISQYVPPAVANYWRQRPNPQPSSTVEQ
jgi:pantetheine-phosphate adenylyltransferase